MDQSGRPPQIVSQLLAHNYVADPELAMALHLAERLKKPLLIEGEAGVGKTEVARVLARMADTQLVRLQCYEGLDFNSALYEWNYQKQILSLRIHEARDEADVALADFYSEDYLSFRPISRALLAPKPVVLLIDEIDRADEEFEALLLETLAEFQLSIPEIGLLEAKSVPRIVLTSNRTRELTDALRRRCLYLWIDYPSYEKELEVVRLKVADIDLELAAQAARFVQALRQESLNKKPGLSETVDWAQALVTTGATRLSQTVVRNTMSCLLKDRGDSLRLREELLEPLLEKAISAAAL